MISAQLQRLVAGAARPMKSRYLTARMPTGELGPGEIGQIGGRGACLMLGYYANQEATEDSYNSTGWFLSGDLGMLDEAGNLTVSGRLKDLIIRGGHNIHPTTIEALALRHEHIEKAAAFPVADERLGRAGLSGHHRRRCRRAVAAAFGG